MLIPSIETKTGNWSTLVETPSQAESAGCMGKEKELSDATFETIQPLIAMNGRFLLPNR